MRCLNAGLRNAVVTLLRSARLASLLRRDAVLALLSAALEQRDLRRYARLASLLRRDAVLALLSAALEQRNLGDSGLLGPTPGGACVLRLMRRRSFALAFGKLVFGRHNLRSLAFGSPNADLSHWSGCGQGIRLNAASNPSQKTIGSDRVLTRASSQSTLGIPIASWRRREANNFLV